MPEAFQYFIDQTGTEAKAIEEAFAAEHKVRSAEIERAWRYFEGDHDEPLKVQSDGYNDNVVINNVETLTERLTAFLLGDGVTFDSGEQGTEDASDDDITALWAANRGAILQDNLAIGGAVEGHSAVRLMPIEGEYPRITRIKGTHFTAFWDPFDMERVMWYRLQRKAGSQGRRIDYVRGALSENGKEIDHEAEGWVELVYKLKEAPAKGPLGQAVTGWVPDGSPIIWGYPWPPIVDWQNIANPNGYYGKRDIKSAIKLNDALNFILSNLQRIIKHYASPKTVVLGANPGDVVETQVGGLLAIPKENANVMNLEMQSDLSSSMRLAEIITAGLWQSGGMVDPQTMKDQVGTLTNFGLRVLFSDAIKRTDKKRLLYEEAFEEIIRRSLELAGKPVPDKLSTVWPSVLPEDEQVQVLTLGQELERGIISKQTYRAKRGYDNAVEEERLSEETASQDVGALLLGALNRGRQQGV